jgi:hypothetical protein
VVLHILDTKTQTASTKTFRPHLGLLLNGRLVESLGHIDKIYDVNEIMKRLYKGVLCGVTAL